MKPNSFLIIMVNNFLNNYFYQLLVLMFFFSGNFSKISEITFFVAPLLFLRDSFSSNHKSLIISDNKKNLYENLISQRFYFLLFIIFFYSLFFLNFNFDYIELSKELLITILVCLVFFWMYELKLSYYEIRKEKKNIYISLIFILIFYIFFLLFIFFKKDFFLYLIYSIIILVFLKEIKIDFDLKKIKKNDIRFFFDLKFLSTFSTNLVNLAWRYIIFIFLEKDYAGILFSVFAMASFAPSFYNNVIGMTVEKNKKIIKSFYLIYSIYFLTFLGLIFYNYSANLVNINHPELVSFYILTSVFSFAGCIIMTFTIAYRIKILNLLKSNRKKIFKIDILYSFLNLISIIIVYQFFGAKSFSIIFFLSSLLSFIYLIMSNKLHLDDKKYI